MWINYQFLLVCPMDLNTNLPKIACFCLFLGLPKLFTPTSQFFYTDISVIFVTFWNSVIIITMAYPHIPTRQILRMTLMLKSGCWDSMYFSKVNKCLVFVEYRQSLETTKKMDNPGDETDLREFCFYIYDLNGDGYISRQHHLYLWPPVTVKTIMISISVNREEMLTLMKGSLFVQMEEDGMEERDDSVKDLVVITTNTTSPSSLSKN